MIVPDLDERDHGTAGLLVRLPVGPVDELRQLREEYEAVTARPRALRRKADELERAVADAVNDAYGLTAEEVDLLWRTAPPRMPPVPQPLVLTAETEVEAA